MMACSAVPMELYGEEAERYIDCRYRRAILGELPNGHIGHEGEHNASKSRYGKLAEEPLYVQRAGFESLGAGRWRRTNRRIK